ncbi:DUF2927 domain-containing protein [Vibrio aquaticus]|uniref:DUF2927 domain-containing protein n=1 Tax=Vibrio aquaticus TaxID=2496559 RepID=A0A432CV71_9VIBR|nr:DUF2927 domain-containing protein [Vibrio aquaticus]RTZ15619.1 DUF2927 domain-containing protein [Vibrio aquaticus]
MLRIATALLTTLLASFPLIAQTYPDQRTWLDPNFVTTAFIDVALRNEYSSGEKPLVKWNKPLAVWVKHKVPDQALHDELTDAHLNHLSQITGLPIKRVSSRSQANVIWIYTRESKWEEDIEKEMGADSLKHVRGAICKAGYRVGSDNYIDSAAIIIPVDRAREHGKLLACIVEEITQTLGLPNDAESAFPSIFNDNTPEDLLSPLDVVLLQLLYQPELTAGMTEQQARPIVMQLVRQYQKDGTLNRAVAIAKDGELFQLIGY